MTTRTLGFILAGLGVALGLALLISPLASPFPDGLERAAEDLGFAGAAGETTPLWRASPLADYLFPGIQREYMATALAGLIGTLAAFAAGLLLGGVLRRKHHAVPKDPPRGTSSR